MKFWLDLGWWITTPIDIVYLIHKSHRQILISSKFSITYY